METKTNTCGLPQLFNCEPRPNGSPSFVFVSRCQVARIWTRIGGLAWWFGVPSFLRVNKNPNQPPKHRPPFPPKHNQQHPPAHPTPPQPTPNSEGSWQDLKALDIRLASAERPSGLLMTLLQARLGSARLGSARLGSAQLGRTWIEGERWRQGGPYHMCHGQKASRCSRG